MLDLQHDTCDIISLRKIHNTKKNILGEQYIAKQNCNTTKVPKELSQDFNFSGE